MVATALALSTPSPTTPGTPIAAARAVLPSATATPSGTPTGMSALAVMSLEEAVAMTLAEIDPLADPTVTVAVAVGAPIEGLRADLNYGRFGAAETCDGLHLVVGVSYMAAARVLDYLDYDPSPGTATPDPDFGDVPRVLVNVYCASTAELVASLPWLPGDAQPWGIGGTSVPFHTVAPDPTGTIVSSTRQPTPTVGPTEPPLPVGRPSALYELPPASRQALQAFPLLPGSTWTYLVRAYDLGASRWLVTETVRSAVLLPDDRLLATVSVDRSPPSGLDGIDYERGFVWPSIANGSAQSQIYWLLDGGAFYRLASPSEVVAKLEELAAGTPQPWPTAMPDDSHWLRWPVTAGDSWSQAPLQPTWGHPYFIWHSPAEASVNVVAGHYEDCVVTALEFSTGGLHNWFCPGVGFVRLQGSSWSVVPDTGYIVAELAASRPPDQLEQ